MTVSASPSNRSQASTGRSYPSRHWSDDRWQSFNMNRAPRKPDPDVLAIAANLRTTYARAKMLKALSYGIPVDADLLAWCAGLGMNADAGVRETHYLRKFVTLHLIRGLSGGTISYVIHDETSLRRIREAMNP